MTKFEPICNKSENAYLNEIQNIARGTTDPGIASITWIIFPDWFEWHFNWLYYFQIWSPDGARATCISYKFGHQMSPLKLVPNLVTRWHHVHKSKIWSPDGATCISSKFGHQMAPLALLPNLVTRWRHLHLTNSYKFSHQMVPLALVQNLVTRWRHLH